MEKYMAIIDLREKTNASTGQTKRSLGGQAASLESFRELEKKVQEQDKKLDKILKLLRD
tara:strand:+ start:910 stop:1086 length:177 start_codon:yes stop_codon:yes gene_type:complete